MKIKEFLISNKIKPKDVKIQINIWDEIMNEGRIPTFGALERIVSFLGGESKTKQNIVRELLWESIKETQALSKVLNVILHIKPMAAPRPRFGYNRTYMPKGYQKWKKEVGELIRPFGRITGPISIDVEYHFKAPSGSTWGYHTKRMDIDNLDKSLLDAFQDCGFIEDDKFVHSLSSKKFYTWQNAIIISLKYNNIWGQ